MVETNYGRRRACLYAKSQIPNLYILLRLSRISQEVKLINFINKNVSSASDRKWALQKLEKNTLFHFRISEYKRIEIE